MVVELRILGNHPFSSLAQVVPNKLHQLLYFERLDTFEDPHDLDQEQNSPESHFRGVHEERYWEKREGLLQQVGLSIHHCDFKMVSHWYNLALRNVLGVELYQHDQEEDRFNGDH